MNRWIAGATLCALALSGCGGDNPPPEKAKPVAHKTAPLVSGIDKANFDSTVRPQDDLYRAVNGTWLKDTKIPDDKSNYGAFTALADNAEEQIRGIVETIAAKKTVADGSNEQKIRDFYAAFMDEDKANQLGVEPIKPLLDKIAGVNDVKQIPALMAELSRMGIHTPLQPYVHQGPEDATQYVGDFWQGGLGLPDRDYYLTDDKKFNEIRAQYLEHITKMLKLAGIADPAGTAHQIMALETHLAQSQWDKVKNRDPIKTNNAYKIEELAGVTPHLDWKSYLDAIGYGKLDSVQISQPSFVTDFGELLRETPLATWKHYFQWEVINHFASLLSKDFVDEDFAFYSGTLNGIQAQRPRWKRGISALENNLGFAVGKLYVAQYFPAENKARMEQLVNNLLAAYKGSIQELTWMSDDTKKAALVKLSKFHYKIGYPDKWRDYSAFKVVPGDSVGNDIRGSEFEYQREVDKLGQPVDHSEWGMTPQTVNAYYNPEMNEVVFPAAILQPPFFQANADDAVNYGGIGAVIGHEISHGFDDQGSQYDGDGNLRSWWTDEDRKKFEALTTALGDQYDTYEPVPGYHVNGKFTMGENIADLGGLTIAHRAYEISLNGKPGPTLDGMTADQRFFMGWAQVWRRKYREENLLNRLKTDPHSPSEFRCNGVVTNLPSFYAAFDVKEGDKLYKAPDQRIKIW